MKLIQIALLSLILSTPLLSQGKLTLNSSEQVLKTYQDADGKRYDIHANPHPKEAFEFTATLINAPKELVVKEVMGWYKSECAISVNKLAGAYTNLREQLPITFNKVQENTYKATIYNDAILDEDYQRTGQPCKWQLIGAIMILEPQPNLAKIRYSSVIRVGQIDYVSEGYWKYDGYISRNHFNEPSNRKEILKDSAVNREVYGSLPDNQLAIVRTELRRK